MFNTVRGFVNSSLLNVAFLYAVFTTLRRAQRRPVEPEKVVQGLAPLTSITLGIPELKLWVMLTSLAALSFVRVDVIPLLTEIRVIVAYILVFSPSFTQQEVYDMFFSPFLSQLTALVRSFHRGTALKWLALFVVRYMVALAVVIMNYIECCGSMDPETVKEIIDGLMLTKRTLDEAASCQANAKASPLFLFKFLSPPTTAAGCSLTSVDFLSSGSDRFAPERAPDVGSSSACSTDFSKGIAGLNQKLEYYVEGHAVHSKKSLMREYFKK
ncbi:unnamed protein product [Phytomonas sp. EM1]|nr:unnamed protein product [Phytomonas sp. EM1]|eukprot:CCW61389.1 unnamed protein product [Phytomonas sp. isolate EM1]